MDSVMRYTATDAGDVQIVNKPLDIYTHTEAEAKVSVLITA